MGERGRAITRECISSVWPDSYHILDDLIPNTDLSLQILIKIVMNLFPEG